MAVFGARVCVCVFVCVVEREEEGKFGGVRGKGDDDGLGGFWWILMDLGVKCTGFELQVASSHTNTLARWALLLVVEIALASCRV